MEGHNTVSVGQSLLGAISIVTRDPLKLQNRDIYDLFNDLRASLQRVNGLEITLAQVLPVHSLRSDLTIWTHEIAEILKAGRLDQVTGNLSIQKPSVNQIKVRKELQDILRSLRFLLNDINNILRNNDLLLDPS